MKILIFGASGFVGSNIVKQLENSQNELFLFQHSKNTKTSYNVKIITGDILNSSDVAQAIAGKDIVINAVGIIKEKRPDQTFENIHFKAVENILKGVGDQNIFLIQISALGTRRNIDTEYFQTKLKAEEAIKSSGIKYTILEPSIIWGEEGFSVELKKLIRIPPFTPVIGNGHYLFQPVLVKDLALIVSKITQDTKIFTNKIFEVGGNKVYSLKDLILNLEQNIGRRKLHFYSPIALIRFGVIIATFLHLPFPITKDQLKMIETNNITDNKVIWELTHIIPQEIF